MSKQKGVSTDGSFERIPNEIMLQIFSWLDFETALKARCVNSKWKALIDVSRNLTVTCHLTDDTVSTVVNATEEFPFVKIHNLLKPVGACSSSRGVGRILQFTEDIEVSGQEIDAEELSKIMKWAKKSLQSLSIQNCRSFVAKSLISGGLKFENLTKLSLTFDKFPKKWHTSLFQTLSKKTSSFPSLHHLKILHRLADVNDLHDEAKILPINEMFKHYWTIIKVVIAFKRTLKRVEIIRDDILRTALMLHQNQNNNPVRVSSVRHNQINACLEALRDVQLDELHITPLIDEGFFPWNFETSLLQTQRELKEITVNRMLSFLFQAESDLIRILPTNMASLTSVKISMTCFENNNVNMGIFAQCSNLNTLWLIHCRGVRYGPASNNTVHFTNIEQLPTTITSLHLKSSQDATISFHEQSILNRNQLRWVIDNLRDLESLWVQLVTEQRLELEDANNGAGAEPVIEVDDGEDEMPPLEPINVNLERINVHANIDVATFTELLRLSKLKEMKFDMLKAAQLAAIIRLRVTNRADLNATPEDIREYIDICQDERSITFESTPKNVYPFEFAELTILKKKPNTYFTN